MELLVVQKLDTGVSCRLKTAFIKHLERAELRDDRAAGRGALPPNHTPVPSPKKMWKTRCRNLACVKVVNVSLSLSFLLK